MLSRVMLLHPLEVSRVHVSKGLAKMRFFFIVCHLVPRVVFVIMNLRSSSIEGLVLLFILLGSMMLKLLVHDEPPVPMHPQGRLRASLIHYEHFRLQLLRRGQEHSLLDEGGVLDGLVEPLAVSLILLMLL